MKWARERRQSLYDPDMLLYTARPGRTGKDGGPPGLLRSAHVGNDWPCIPPWAMERYWPIQTEKEGNK